MTPVARRARHERGAEPHHAQRHGDAVGQPARAPRASRRV
jgi:hypothetical protein